MHHQPLQLQQQQQLPQLPLLLQLQQLPPPLLQQLQLLPLNRCTTLVIKQANIEFRAIPFHKYLNNLQVF